jgi:hypothetical protein
VGAVLACEIVILKRSPAAQKVQPTLFSHRREATMAPTVENNRAAVKRLSKHAE